MDSSEALHNLEKDLMKKLPAGVSVELAVRPIHELHEPLLAECFASLREWVERLERAGVQVEIDFK